MCEPARNGTVGTLVAMAGVAAVWLLRAAWAVLQVLTAVLVAVLVWVAPRAWRLTVRVTRAGHRRWVARRLARTAPVAAITDHADRVTWSELRLKREANVR